jgi:hypothetical protein
LYSPVFKSTATIVLANRLSPGRNEPFCELVQLRAFPKLM